MWGGKSYLDMKAEGTRIGGNSDYLQHGIRMKGPNILGVGVKTLDKWNQGSFPVRMFSKFHNTAILQKKKRFGDKEYEPPESFM